MTLDAVDADDRTVYVDYDRADRGSKGPFYVVFVSEDREKRWGFYCGNCETLDNAMDSMGRIVCNVCDNLRKPEEWDAAHE